MQGLLTDNRLTDKTMGLLLSFALHDFSMATLFTSVRELETEARDAKLAEYLPRIKVVLRPGAIRIIWGVIPHLAPEDTSLRQTIYKTMEHLARSAHRNQVILGSLGLFESAFALYRTTVSPAERPILQKLLKRLLDIGASATEARALFKQAINEDGSLSPEVLDLIRAGMKARWPEHFSFEGRSALVFKDENVKGLPATGFTYMVRILFPA